MAVVLLLPAAERDLLDRAEYYDAQSDTALGDRFLHACEAGFARLSTFPESGTTLRFRHPQLHSIRFILVPGFENILIYYRFADNQVRVIRVLHGKQHVDQNLDGE